MRLPQNTLHPIFTVQVTGDLYAITSVAADSNPLGAKPNRPHIIGTSAHYLYLSLAGHVFGTHPDSANLIVAKHARALIERYQISPFHPIWREVESFNLAGRVLAHWGEFIQPWLGVMMLDKQNRPIVYHPKYKLRIYFESPTIAYATI